MACNTSRIVVLGGGPAGAAAARLLASWNHSVDLVTKPAGGSSLAVSLPPSCSKLFDAVGMTSAIDRASFIRSTGNTVWWGNDEPRVEMFQAGVLGWQADLQRLAGVMLAHAADNRVRVIRSGSPSPVARTAPDTAFVLDCTGRAGVIAKERGLREYDEGPRTVALVGEWHTGRSWAVMDDTQTIIESYGDGWMWSVPVSPGVRHVSAMVDPQRSDLARGRSSRDVYLAEVGKTRQFKRLLADASLRRGPWGLDASTYRSREYAGAGWLLVGDAASFIDPLSSAGVQKALASAWLAAVVAHTCVTKPSMQSHALSFFSAREREIERRYADAARLFLSDAAKEHRQAFWADRHVEPALEDSETAVVRAAFDRLKDADVLRLRVSRGIGIAPRAYVEGHEIVLGAHVVSDDDGAGVRYLYNVDVAVLVELAPTVDQVADLLEAYAQRRGDVDLHDFLAALATAVARGWLVAE